MPLFTSTHARLPEILAYFLAAIAIGFGGGVVLSVLQIWLQTGAFGVGLALPVATSALAGVCFVSWAVNVAVARRRTARWRV
ncbi:MAG: hypothetical protein GC155_11905 [Alphaproteobacteria bacterium]|nr:hypothetical protein [Alphaproteobacteria bacterium]